MPKSIKTETYKSLLFAAYSFLPCGGNPMCSDFQPLRNVRRFAVVYAEYHVSCNASDIAPE
jgi:hypothetical protein